ncbi:hypothetical protein ACFL1J_00825 [Pseudomonadota bacterium]
MQLPWPIGAVMALLCYTVALILSGYIASQPSQLSQALSSLSLQLWLWFSAMFGFSSLMSSIVGQRRTSSSHGSREMGVQAFFSKSLESRFWSARCFDREAKETPKYKGRIFSRIFKRLLRLGEEVADIIVNETKLQEIRSLSSQVIISATLVSRIK